VKLGLPVGHTGSVWDSKFSRDGSKIVTCSSDNTVKVWSSETGLLLLDLIGHTNIVRHVDFSPDNQLILSASDDKTIKIWHSQTGELMHTLIGHTDQINSAHFSPDGLSVISAGDFSARIWDVGSGKLVFNLSDHQDIVEAAEFSPDGKIVITGSWDKTVKVWDAKTGVLKHTLKSDDLIQSAKFNSTGSLILIASKNGKIQIWNVSSLKKKIEINLSKGFGMAGFSPDDQTIFTSLSDNDDYTAQVWNAQTGELMHDLKGHSGLITDYAYSANGRFLITTSSDKTAKIWDVSSGSLMGDLIGHTKVVTSAALSPDCGVVVTTSNDYSVKMWSVRSAGELRTLNNRSNPIQSARFNHSGTSLLTLSKDLISILDSQTGKLFKSSNKNYETAIFSSDDSSVLVSSDGFISLFSTDNFERILKFKAHNYDIKGTEFNLSGDQMVSISEDLKIWNSYSGEMIHSFSLESEAISSAVFNKNGSLLLIGSPDYAILYEIGSGRILKRFEGHENMLHSAIFSPDESMIITATHNGIVKLWSMKSGKLSHSFRVSERGLYSFAIHPDGNSLLFSLADGFSLLTNLNGDVIQMLKGHNGAVLSSVFSKDGKNILTSSRDGSLIIWKTETGEQLIRQFVFDNNPELWLHLHPSGLFDASPEAMELMYWTKGLEVIEFAQLKDRYWVPGLWEKVMKGEALPEIQGMNDLKLQPEVILGEFKDGKIPVTLMKREGGYGKITIFINGKEIEADAKGNTFDASKETQTFFIDLKDHPNLQNGENTVAVKASSEDGFVQGRPEEKKVTLSLQRSVPHFYAVVVGTGKYMNSSINLKYPEKDATSMSTALKLGAEQLFGADKTHIYTLTTADAERPTKEKIKGVFSEIAAKATSSDIIVIYLSGHGIAWGGERGDFYYLTTDATAANAEAFNDEVLRRNYTISATEFTEYLKAIPANKQVMIIDACSSGKAVDNLMTARDIDVSQIKAIDRMKDRTGMFVISGSTADAVSYEASRYGQGLLTYSVLQAMKGAALRDGQFFDVNTIMNYCRENVPRLAAGAGGIQKPQLLVPKGGSFDIGTVDEAARTLIPLSNMKPVFVRTSFIDSDAVFDDLNLSKSVDSELNEISVLGSDAPIVFLDTREFPDAYRLSGMYTQSNGVITLKLKIKGPKESEHTLTAPNKEALIEKVLEVLEGLE
jgi:WD40 repeat protein